MNFEADLGRVAAGTEIARVLLVDPHHLVLLELSRLIDEDQHLEVVATATNAKDTWELVDDHPIDVCVIARGLPDGDGFELCNALRRTNPSMRCVIHSAGEIESDDLARSGAAAIVLKQLSGDDLLQTIRDLAKTQIEGRSSDS